MDLKSRLRKGADVITFREAKEPKLQISMLSKDQQQGDVDIDFDPMRVDCSLPNFLCGCHGTPANSDVGSRKPTSSTDVHLDRFNDDVPYFGPLTIMSGLW